jgi:hypothetical protein
MMSSLPSSMPEEDFYGKGAMATVFQVMDDNQSGLDARFSVDRADIILHSRGGTKGQSAAVNTDYTKALLLLLTRLSQTATPVLGAWVDSTTVQSLPLSARSILSISEGRLAPEDICRLLGNRMKDIRSSPDSTAKGGNSTKRIRISTGFAGSSEDLAARLGGVELKGDIPSAGKLPAEVLRKATPEYVWRAVQEFLAGKVMPAFGPSTDYDLIADDGRRFPPKAVFGLALSMALDNMTILPRHFTAGGLCFDLLMAAGYQIVGKGDAPEPTDDEDYADREWREGGVKFSSHLKRERAPGLASAKKSEFRRLHGKLNCERCGRDPVAEYGTEYAESCIEVHHAETCVSDMGADHKTTLDDLQCLCANCHRLVHRTLREEKKRKAS